MSNKILNQLSLGVKRIVSSIFPDESITHSKNKWNKLAEENPRYYVVSRKGRDITESDFQEVGRKNYEELISGDITLKERLVNFNNKKVLDIGCGLGRLEEFFSPNFKEVYGVDISEQMVEQAKERLKKYRNIHLSSTDGITLPFDKGFFDFVFSYLVFQHMPSREVVEKNFIEVFRVLKENGIAKIQIRGGHTPFKWQWFYGPSWSEEKAVKMVEKIGFRVLKTEGENTKRFWLWLTK